MSACARASVSLASLRHSVAPPLPMLPRCTMLFRFLITIEFFRVTGFVFNNNNDVIIDDNPYCRSNNQSFPRNPFHQTNNPASIASSRSKVEMFGEILKARAQELRRTPNRKVELVFLVDASASVGAEEFLNELKFVKKLLADFTVDRHSTRVSVITFSSKSRIIRHIDHLSHPRDDNHKCSLMEEELPKIEFSGGGTYTLGAVLEAQNVFRSARPDAKKALFLITDGYSNSGDPRTAAEKLKEDNVEIFTFGIRQGNFRELCDMASESKEQHTYILDSFDEFEALARRAFHEDLHAGNYIIQNSTKCDSLCDEKRDCCDFLSTCRCGTRSGKYECVCQAGYYGNGLKNGCIACPEGTYKNYTGPGDKRTCIPCPDPGHTSPPGSTSVHQCQCKRGYRPIDPHACADSAFLRADHGIIMHVCDPDITHTFETSGICACKYKSDGCFYTTLCRLYSTFDLEFPSSGITDYLVIEDPFGDRNLTAVTISMWMKTNDKNNQGTPVSYATDTYDNALVITDYTGFVIYVNGFGRVTDTTANDNRWHHIVMTWSSELGSWKICKDGEIIESGVGMMSGTTIEGGGVLVVGQEQDSRGGKFSSAESYVGKMSKLNIWDRELTMDEIQSQSINCDEVIGNLVAWSDFLAGLNGRVGYMDTQLCKGCSPPENLTDGEATWTDTKLNSSVHYTCKPGFDLTGPDVRFCKSDTTWSGSELKCERKSCGHPGAIANGYLATISVVYGYTAIYKCSPGYRMDGNHTLYCNASGLWEGRLGTCKEIICPTPVLPPNLRFTTNKMSDYKPGDVARFTCNPGYRLVGPRNSSKCNSAGIWDNALPACEEVRCSAPPNITNGRPDVKPDEIFTTNHYVVYKCNPGFAILGSVDRIMCFHPGVWSVKIPICQEIRCRTPPSITNGFLVGSNFTQGSVVKYQCYDGYLIKGHADVLLCMETGVWNGTAPSCERVKCRRPDPVGNGSVDVVDDPTYMAVVRYKCNTGYILIGNSERKCLMTSVWSGTPPSCDPVGCAPPGEIPHGKVTGAGYFLGDVIEYSCDEGYSLVEKRTCGPYGLWSMSEPSCLPIKCPDPGNLLYGHIVGSNYFYKGVIEFACISGYRLNGVAKQECTARAEWSDDRPVCEKVF